VSKKQLYLLGFITLLIFPIPAFCILHFIEGTELPEFLQLDNIKPVPIGYGLLFGIIYAFFALIILKAEVFQELPLQIDKIVKDLHLNYLDGVFLSLCAGIGEELLFRSGMQHYLGVVATSIIFVGIHGYIGIKNVKMSLYGIVVLPFILLISMGFVHFGLWFSISAHFAYDLTLFYAMIGEEKDLSDK
jgi:membrane protease YdiL (CAAX protease family)